MTDKPDNGGPAFPQTCLDALDVGQVHAGMDLRDWFAGQALMGLMHRALDEYPPLEGGTSYVEHFAHTAYAYADAMLKARGQ